MPKYTKLLKSMPMNAPRGRNGGSGVTANYEMVATVYLTKVEVSTS